MALGVGRTRLWNLVPDHRGSAYTTNECEVKIKYAFIKYAMRFFLSCFQQAWARSLLAQKCGFSFMRLL